MVKHDVYLWTGETEMLKNAQVSVNYISRAFFLCFVLWKNALCNRGGTAYVTNSCEISRGLELKNPSMWQEESAIVPTFYIIFCSPKIKSLQKQQSPNAATSESNEGSI